MNVRNVDPRQLPMLPVDANQAINEARSSDGRYKIVIWTADDKGEIHMRRISGEHWKYDWHLRATRMLVNDMMDIDIPK